jgi:hypothetical protein
MVIIESSDSISMGGYVVKLPSKIRQYYEFENAVVIRTEPFFTKSNEIQKNLFAYGYSDNNYQLLWEFPVGGVIGIEPEIPEKKSVEDFVTPEHYIKYMEQFKGKDLLIIYVGDHRLRVDANTGKVYDSTLSR